MSLLKTKITQYLQKKNLYEELIDDVLINQLLKNIDLMNFAEADIQEHGWRINTTRNKEKKPYHTTNPSVNVYRDSLKVVRDLYCDLSLNIRERRRLNIELKGDKPTENDGFDQI